MSTALAPVNIETEIEQSDNPGALLDTMLARLEYDIELANTTEEANEIRARIEAVKTYAKRKLPAVMKDRAQRFQYTFHAGKDYILASAKAGAYWNTLGDRRKPGNSNPDLIDWQSAGFRHPRDATTCGRIAQLHNEDLRTYFDECNDIEKQPSLYGAESVWINQHKDNNPDDSRREARKYRRHVMYRAHGKCEVCRLDCMLIGEVHHVVAASEGGNGYPENLIHLCPNCHATVEMLRRKNSPGIQKWLHKHHGDEQVNLLNALARGKVKLQGRTWEITND